MSPILYLALILIELVFLIGISVYLILLIYSSVMGSPYVPSHNRLIEMILKTIKPKKTQKILELGCGDGRFLRIAAKKYGVSGLGIDVNPFVISIAKLRTRMQHINSLQFKVKNLFDQSYKDFDIIYLFLMPELLKKMAPKLRKEIKPATLVISHGFKIPGCDSYITRTLLGKPFYTYFYRFPKSKSH